MQCSGGSAWLGLLNVLTSELQEHVPAQQGHNTTNCLWDKHHVIATRAEGNA